MIMRIPYHSADNPSVRQCICASTREKGDDDGGHRQRTPIVQLSIEEGGLIGPTRASSDQRTHPIIRLRTDLHARGVFVYFAATRAVGRQLLADRFDEVAGAQRYNATQLTQTQAYHALYSNASKQGISKYRWSMFTRDASNIKVDDRLMRRSLSYTFDRHQDVRLLRFRIGLLCTLKQTLARRCVTAILLKGRIVRQSTGVSKEGYRGRQMSEKCFPTFGPKS